MKNKVYGILWFVLGFALALALNSAKAATLDEQLLSKQISDLQTRALTVEKTVADQGKQLALLQSAITVSPTSVTILSNSISMKASSTMSLLTNGSLNIKGTVVKIDGLQP